MIIPSKNVHEVVGPDLEEAPPRRDLPELSEDEPEYEIVQTSDTTRKLSDAAGYIYTLRTKDLAVKSGGKQICISVSTY